MAIPVKCFLKCSTNKRKETVEDLFLQSVEKYSWPSRIRTDHGGENLLVWERMIEFEAIIVDPHLLELLLVTGE